MAPPRATSDAPTCAQVPDPLLKLQTAAERLDAEPRWLREQISKGRIQGFRLAGDRQIRVRQSDIDTLLVPIPTVRVVA
jgi:hypothetical protein